MDEKKNISCFNNNNYSYLEKMLLSIWYILYTFYVHNHINFISMKTKNKKIEMWEIKKTMQRGTLKYLEVKKIKAFGYQNSKKNMKSWEKNSFM